MTGRARQDFDDEPINDDPVKDGSPGEGPDGDPPPSSELAGEETLFPDFHTWVGEWLVPVIHRPLKSGTVWCPEWWRHAEAVGRLHALWQAWESSRVEGGPAMSYWWTMHFDPHFTVLTDSTHGPFSACKEQVHDATKPAALPCEPPPSDWDWPGGQILGV